MVWAILRSPGQKMDPLMNIFHIDIHLNRFGAKINRHLKRSLRRYVPNTGQGVGQVSIPKLWFIILIWTQIYPWIQSYIAWIDHFRVWWLDLFGIEKVYQPNHICWCCSQKAVFTNFSFPGFQEPWEGGFSTNFKISLKWHCEGYCGMVNFRHAESFSTSDMAKQKLLFV